MGGAHELDQTGGLLLSTVTARLDGTAPLAGVVTLRSDGAERSRFIADKLRNLSIIRG